MDVTCDGHSVYGKPFEPTFGSDLYLRSSISLPSISKFESGS